VYQKGGIRKKMKKLRKAKKLLKSKKALSPVVAAIILIAVTVAVSIAVAAWMGALTFTWMKTEEITITGATYYTGSSPYVNITMTNSGAYSVAITNAKVDDLAATLQYASGASWVSINSTSPYTLDKGNTYTVRVTKPSGNFIVNIRYNFAIISQSGHIYTYQATKT